MVAKAAQNLFDVSVGGAGFHFTSHLIALVALFIACFAIAGYISYRSDSIPSSALKDQDQDFGAIVADSLQLSGGPVLEHVRIFTDSTFGTQNANVTTNLVTTAAGTTAYSLPANAAVKHMVVTTTTPLTSDATNVATLNIGTSATTATSSNNFAGAQAITALDTVNDRLLLSPTNTGSSATAGFVTITVVNGTENLLTGALAVDLYYYQY